jgi:NAD dependent epimerase/dehydratase family enzyme
MANELTGSQRVLPARLTRSGFTFTTADARSALRAALQ